MFSANAIIALAVAAISVKADHLFTLKNNCPSGVDMSIDTWSGTPYTGSQPPTLGTGSSWSTTIPDGWDGRLCHNRNCYGGGSMTEYNLVGGGLSWYDISNIEGFSIGQQIQAEGGDTVTCQSASCSCTQAYAQGNTAGTCPGSSSPDAPVRATGTANAAFMILFCP